jgi:hypothetical protein
MADDTTAALAAPFDSPPSPLDMVPAIRWAFHESGYRCHLVDVIHYREDGGHFTCHYSLIAAERNGRSWDFDAVEGPELDFGSADLLASDMSKESRDAACAYRIDELDMSIERCRLSLERKLGKEAA